MEDKVSIQFLPRGIYITGRGELTSQDIHKIAFIDHSDERSVDAKFIVSDFLQATAESILSRDIDKALAIDIGASRSTPDLKLAFVANNESTVSCCSYYMERAHKLNLPWEIQIFSTSEAALNWCQG